MLEALKNLINDLLRFDPKTTHYTKRLEGCCLEITLQSPQGMNLMDRSYRITFCSEGLETLEQLEPTPSFPRKPESSGVATRESCLDPRLRGNDNTARIAGTPLTFAGLLLDKNSRDRKKDLIMEGDPEILICLDQWLHDCEIDWAEILAGFLGDSAAYTIDSTFHRLKTVGRQRLHNLAAAIEAYAVEEGLLAPSALIDPFLESVDALRARIDRLEAKL